MQISQQSPPTLAFFYDSYYSRSRLRQIRVQPSRFKEPAVNHLSFLKCQHCYTQNCLLYALILSSSLLCKSIQSLFNLPVFHYLCVCLTLSACAEDIVHMVVDVGPCQGDQAGRQPVGRGGGGQQEADQVRARGHEGLSQD